MAPLKKPSDTACLGSPKDRPKSIIKTSSKRSWKPSRLLNLPAEIRNTIYRYILVFDGVEPGFRFEPKGRTNVMNGLIRLNILTRGRYRQIYGGRDFRDSPFLPACEVLALLSTCRQIYKEARVIFWTENAFVFDRGYQRAIFWRWLDHGCKTLITRIGTRLFEYEDRLYHLCNLGNILFSWNFSVNCALYSSVDYASHTTNMLRVLCGTVSTTFTKELDQTSNSSNQRAASLQRLEPERRDGFDPRTSLPIHPPPYGAVRAGSIFDCGPTGVLADYHAGKRTSLDILGDCIHQCIMKDSAGWEYALERRVWQYEDPLRWSQTGGETYVCLGEVWQKGEPRCCYLWLNRSQLSEHRLDSWCF